MLKVRFRLQCDAQPCQCSPPAEGPESDTEDAAQCAAIRRGWQLTPTGWRCPACQGRSVVVR